MDRRFFREILASATFEDRLTLKAEEEAEMKKNSNYRSRNRIGRGVSSPRGSPATTMSAAGNATFTSYDSPSSAPDLETKKKAGPNSATKTVIRCMKLALNTSLESIGDRQKDRRLVDRDFESKSKILFKYAADNNIPTITTSREHGKRLYRPTRLKTGGLGGCCVGGGVKAGVLDSMSENSTETDSDDEMMSPQQLPGVGESTKDDFDRPPVHKHGTQHRRLESSTRFDSSINKKEEDEDDSDPQPQSFAFTAYSPMCYRQIRDCFGVDSDDFKAVLCNSGWHSIPTPGKSAAQLFFCGQNWVIKTTNKEEGSFLRTILHRYFDHVRDNPYTLLPRFMGHYRLTLPGQPAIAFVIMQNVFATPNKINEKFDLKGSTIGRFSSKAEKTQATRTKKDLDINRPINIGAARRELLIDQIKADCTFLRMSDIMDYSLLVGIHHIPEGTHIDESSALPQVMSLDARGGGTNFASHAQHRHPLQSAYTSVSGPVFPTSSLDHNQPSGVSAPSSFADQNTSIAGGLGGFAGYDTRPIPNAGPLHYHHKRVETDLSPTLASVSKHHRSATFGASSSPLLSSLPLSTANHLLGQGSPSHQFLGSPNGSIVHPTSPGKGGVGGVVPPEMMSSTVAGGHLRVLSSSHHTSDTTGTSSPLNYRSNIRTTTYAPVSPASESLTHGNTISTPPGKPAPFSELANSSYRVSAPTQPQLPQNGGPVGKENQAQQLLLYNQRLQQLQHQGSFDPTPPRPVYDPTTIVPPAASVGVGGVGGFDKRCFTAFQGGMLSDRAKAPNNAPHNIHENAKSDGPSIANTTSLANSAGAGGVDSENEDVTTRPRRATGVDRWVPNSIANAKPENISSVAFNSAIAGNSPSSAHGTTASGSLFPNGAPEGAIPEQREAREVYYIGIIDILQEYNARKTPETYLKSIFNERAKVSSVPAKEYAARFVSFMSSVVV